jgi:hypothetical protein
MEILSIQKVDSEFVLNVYTESGLLRRTVELPSNETIEVKGGKFTKEFLLDLKTMHGVTIVSI